LIKRRTAQADRRALCCAVALHLAVSIGALAQNK